MNDYLNRIYFNNTVRDYLLVFAAIIITWIVLQILKRIIITSVKKLTGRSKTNIDDALISGFEKFLVPYIYILINFAIIDQLKLSAGVNKVINVAATIVTVYYGARFINHALQLSLNLYMQRRGEPSSRVLQMNGILNILKVIVWMLGLLFLLDNLGFEVTTIITGLGIGGIAIALAAQNILGDLFSYFVIFFDKPFEIGDFVVAGDKSGTVEQIGIKTSRIRTLGGEELVMPNAELVKTPIHNFKRQEKRRVVFNPRVSYNTAPSLLREIPELLKQIISSKENAVFDRAHLASLGEYFISYEVVFNIPTADFNLYMDLQQSIYLEIIETFKARNIEFAMSNKSVMVEKDMTMEKDEEASKNDKPLTT
ncbi:MAG: Small-conductance mechanosensitive channel [Segetibacter sp.]|nr:Small-conductance mechanosensitive channel [Segetibacter sp.]